MRQLVLLVLVVYGGVAGARETIFVGSKNFTESYVLAEVMALQLEGAGFDVQRRFGLGGTKICYDALRAGDIDVYPEYTGTILEVVLSDHEAGEMREQLAVRGLRLGPPFGFNNTYAIAVGAELAASAGLRRISDLAAQTGLRASVSHEFLERPDGWPGLARRYGLVFRPDGIEHGLAYKAIADGVIDLTDAYSTDGELNAYRLTVLEDDLGYFPQYLAAPLMRDALPELAKDALDRLAGMLDDASMRRYNARVVVDQLPYATVAREILTQEINDAAPAAARTDSMWRNLTRNTLRHLQLTALALVLATVAGLGLAVAVHRSSFWSGVALNVAGILQTIPSIALLALMIPVFGIGFLPATVALFLYSLLPILRNGVTALTTVDPVYTEVAEAMGMTATQRLRYVLFPLSVPHVLAGVRTAAVISIGTATLAAFIGAGGLGEPIVTGLALNDTRLILQGAIPAALLALATEWLFAGVERAVVPAHLRAAA